MVCVYVPNNSETETAYFFRWLVVFLNCRFFHRGCRRPKFFAFPFFTMLRVFLVCRRWVWMGRKWRGLWFSFIESSKPSTISIRTCIVDKWNCMYWQGDTSVDFKSIVLWSYASVWFFFTNCYLKNVKIHRYARRSQLLFKLAVRLPDERSLYTYGMYTYGKLWRIFVTNFCDEFFLKIFIDL